LVTDIASDITKDLPNVDNWLANIQKQSVIQQSIKVKLHYN